MRQDITIRPEKEAEFKYINQMICESFSKETDYSDGTDVVGLVEDIRAHKYYIPDLSFVAELEGKIVGHFMFSHFPLGRTFEMGNFDKDIIKTEIVVLGPVCVHPEYHRQDIGRSMLLLGIEEVRRRGYKGITVEGNPSVYNKVGFRTSAEFGVLPSENCKYPQIEPKCLMAQELYDGALDEVTGYVDYSMYDLSHV